MTPIARYALPVLLMLALEGCAHCSLDDLRRAAGLKPVNDKTEAVKHRAERPAAPTARAAASPGPIETGSINKTDAPSGGASEVEAERIAAEKTEEGRRWCRQRFIDFQEGKRPGEARTVEQKEADDRVCEALLESGR